MTRKEIYLAFCQEFGLNQNTLAIMAVIASDTAKTNSKLVEEFDEQAIAEIQKLRSVLEPE